jgi:predicted translin family RNA/ssDNA-binding protein
MIEKSYTSIAADVQGINAHRYANTITHGNQEFMEAISFRHYLEAQNMITPSEAQSQLTAVCPDSATVTLSQADFLLGIFDMTGELMKLAITVMATGGHTKDSINQASQHVKILLDMRELRIHLENLTVPHGNNDLAYIRKKMDVMKTSVEKVENAFYGLTVRGAERPRGWVPEEKNAGVERVESY